LVDDVPRDPHLHCAFLVNPADELSLVVDKDWVADEDIPQRLNISRLQLDMMLAFEDDVLERFEELSDRSQVVLVPDENLLGAVLRLELLLDEIFEDVLDLLEVECSLLHENVDDAELNFKSVDHLSFV
jgi:hypothetical protein